MTISTDLMSAILAMDAYNRGYNAGIDLVGSQIASATLGIASESTGASSGWEFSLDVRALSCRCHEYILPLAKYAADNEGIGSGGATANRSGAVRREVTFSRARPHRFKVDRSVRVRDGRRVISVSEGHCECGR